ncbi:MAG TPA: hypothetical protein VIQ23_01645 [Hanamia sp.]
MSPQLSDKGYKAILKLRVIDKYFKEEPQRLNKFSLKFNSE